ncbi:MAG TPA: zf-HC2 domain-containing protein, partial [Thermoanaerobaculia bacterium]
MRRTDRLMGLACFTSDPDDSARHAAAESLRRYLDGELSPRDNADLEQQLVTCAACETTLIGLLSPLPESAPEGAAEPQAVQVFLDRMGASLPAALAQRAMERREGEELWRRLERYGTELRRNLVRNSWCYHSRGLFELLLDQAGAAAAGEPRQREELLRLALEVAQRLDPTIYGRGAVEAARGRAWGHLGAALTASGDLQKAEEAFDAASACLLHSWRDPL